MALYQGCLSYTAHLFLQRICWTAVLVRAMQVDGINKPLNVGGQILISSSFNFHWQKRCSGSDSCDLRSQNPSSHVPTIFWSLGALCTYPREGKRSLRDSPFVTTFCSHATGMNKSHSHTEMQDDWEMNFTTGQPSSSDNFTPGERLGATPRERSCAGHCGMFSTKPNGILSSGNLHLSKFSQVSYFLISNNS